MGDFSSSMNCDYRFALEPMSDVASSSSGVTNQHGFKTEILGELYTVENGADEHRPHKVRRARTPDNYEQCRSCSDVDTKGGFTFEDELRLNTQNEVDSVRTHPVCGSVSGRVSV
jgi:hypothetical protein